MKRFLLLIVIVGCVNIVRSQSLIDSALVHHCREAFYNIVLPYEAEVQGGSIVVSETETGNVKALMNFNGHGIEGWSENASTDCLVPALNSPLAIYLALLDAGASPNEYFYSNGTLLDERSGIILRDWNYRYGGVGNITLSRAYERSRVALVEACEQHFSRSMATAAFHMSHTGISLGDNDDSLTDYLSYFERYADIVWQPLSLMGINDKLKVIQVHMYTSGLANNGKLLMPRLCDSDPHIIIYESMAAPQHINLVRQSMRENVLYGLSHKANVDGVDVFGFSNVSDVNGADEQTSLFTGFGDKYTITVIINMFAHNSLIRILPQQIAASIFNAIKCKQKNESGKKANTIYKPHRSEK